MLPLLAFVWWTLFRLANRTRRMGSNASSYAALLGDATYAALGTFTLYMYGLAQQWW